MPHLFYWTEEDGKRPEEHLFKTEAEAKTFTATGEESDCCNPGEHEWTRLATAWEELFSYCYNCGLNREVV